MTLEQIEQKVNSFLIDELEIEEEKITGDARLKDDLGIDSLEVVDVVVYIEESFGFKMKPEDFKVVKTVNELYSFIEEKIG